MTEKGRVPPPLPDCLDETQNFTGEHLSARGYAVSAVGWTLIRRSHCAAACTSTRPPEIGFGQVLLMHAQ